VITLFEYELHDKLGKRDHYQTNDGVDDRYFWRCSRCRDSPPEVT
jgi:hypothetical protein